GWLPDEPNSGSKAWEEAAGIPPRRRGPCGVMDETPYHAGGDAGHRLKESKEGGAELNVRGRGWRCHQLSAISCRPENRIPNAATPRSDFEVQCSMLGVRCSTGNQSARHRLHFSRDEGVAAPFVCLQQAPWILCPDTHHG